MNDHMSDERMAEYLGDELDANERAHIEQHISVCEDCRDRSRKLFGTLRALRQLETVSMRDAAEATERLQIVRVAPVWRRIGATLLKSAAVLAIGVYLGRESTGDQRQPPQRQPVVSAQKAPTENAPAIHPEWIERARQLGLGTTSVVSQLHMLGNTSNQ